MIWIGWHGEDLRDSLSDYAIHGISVFTTGKHKWSDKNAFFTVFDNRAKIGLGSPKDLVQKVISNWVSHRICTNSYPLKTLNTTLTSPRTFLGRAPHVCV